MEKFTDCVGYSKEEILKTLHEVIVENAVVAEMDEVKMNHILVLDAIYHFVDSEF